MLIRNYHGEHSCNLKHALQKGYGLGGLFKGLVRTLAPALKRGLISVGKRALQTGTEVLNDYVQGGDLKTSIKRRAKQNVNDMIRSTILNKSANIKPIANTRSQTVARNTGLSERFQYFKESQTVEINESFITSSKIIFRKNNV